MTDLLPRERVASATLHATILFTIGVFIAILVMSFIFTVEVVARGQGRVVPISRVQVIQPEFSGRIAAIRVQNGMTVAKGDLLIELDPTEATAELGKVQSEQVRLTIESARIDAIVTALALAPASEDFLATARSGFSLTAPLANHPFAAEQRRLLDAELEDYLASLAQLAAREDAGRKSEAVSSANIDRLAATMEIQTERLRKAEQLLQQGTTSRATFLDVQQTFTELERQRDVYLAELDQKAAERAALESERRRTVAELKNTLAERKTQIEARLATLTEEAKTASRRVASTMLLAPTAGVVDRLSVYTIGGVAEAGKELLRVVPTEIAVEIEGTFSNTDIGFLAEGQQANIRLDAYPSERFGFLKARVTDIAADSAEVADKNWAYIVRITPDQAFLTAGDDSFSLRPGMTATIDVTTDERRIISYFFAPIVRTIQDAMGER
jgi:hemolysin D